MDDTMMARPEELGRYLAELRERQGIRQAELARRVTMSPAVLSRIESGERPIASEELEGLLAAIDSDASRRLGEVLSRRWQVLDAPPLDHPDQDVLWAAESVAQALEAAAREPGVTAPFAQRLLEYVAELRRKSAVVRKRHQQVAFIGPIGVGKSTAICRLTGLELPPNENTPLVPALEAGGGRTTVCEVHVRKGLGYGLLVDPCTEDELRAYVEDFVDHLLKSAPSPDAESEDGEGVSQEIERALRNMSGLKVRREKGADGQRLRTDAAKELALSKPNRRDAVVEILARMKLHARDRRDVSWSPATGLGQLEWLAQTFERINNGRHPEFSLPRRIEVVIDRAPIDGTDGPLTIIDTKGVDSSAARGDLEKHLQDPHTLAVLCSTFNNAPGSEARQLLERAQLAGVKAVADRVVLLVLPRATEAQALKDEDGKRVSRDEDGYEIKADHIAVDLQRLRVGPVESRFFDAHRSDPGHLRDALVARLKQARVRMRESLAAVTEEATAVLANRQREQTLAVIRQAGRMFASWAANNEKVPAIPGRAYDALMSELRSAHPATVHASVRREGNWPNLQYSYQLGYGARRLAVGALGRAVEGFATVCETMSGDPDYESAKGLIAQALRVLQDGYDEMLRRMQLSGETAFADALGKATDLWAKCELQWGLGSGYRDRVADYSSKWFSDEQRGIVEQEIRALLEREWKTAADRLKALVDDETATA